MTRSIGYRVAGKVIFSILLIAGLMSMAGCAPQDEYSQTVPNSKFKIIPVSNHEVIALSPDDIVKIMQRVGFLDKQIVELGTDLRNTLGTSGAAQLKIKGRNKIEATFAVHDGNVYISTRLRGTFIYNTKTGWVT